jgi:hypothetical protein
MRVSEFYQFFCLWCYQTRMQPALRIGIGLQRMPVRL